MSLFKKNKKEENSLTPEVKTYNHRLLILKVGFLLFFIVAAARLVQIQILERNKYEKIARQQYEATVPLPASRGNIFDRNGNVLVSNSTFASFTADPTIAGDDAKFIAEQFSRITGKPEQEYLNKLNSDKRFVYVERHVRPDLAEQIPLKQMDGVLKVNETTRLYHYDELCGQVVGVTNAENIGVSGLEYFFEKILRGKDGYVVMQKDGLGRRRPSVDYPREEPVNGNSLTLTIDLNYQSLAEEELKKGIERTQAEAGLVVMLRPHTGEVLAMANYPTVNPNKVINADALKNRIISDMFEPGSVFKIVTATAALQNKLVTLNQQFYAENGKYQVKLAGNKFRVISDTHPHGVISFEEAMAVSSNIVMAKVSDKIGPEKLYTQARNFGFGMPTGIELPGEISGDVKKPVDWSGTTLNTMAYGYEVGVTPLQIVAAYGALANNGVLMRPYIIQKEVDAMGKEVRVGEPQMIRRVMSEETAELLKKMFTSVVEHGTGSIVKIPGVAIAGKTGTSRKHVNGKYEEGSYNASFVGFFPVEKPEIVCLVIIEKPKAGGYTGAVASAPIFKGIAERIINNNGLISKTTIAHNRSSATSKQTALMMPDVCNSELDIAEERIEKLGLKYKVVGSGEIVRAQFPDAGKKIEQGDIIQFIMNENVSQNSANENVGANIGVGIPNVCGMSLRRAINKLTNEKFDIAVVGSGVVMRQFPEAGIAANRGSKITLLCEPKQLTTAQLY